MAMSNEVTRSVTTGRVQRDTYRAAKKELTALIAYLANTGVDRLPSEEDLSARLEVSRATVRSALLSLQVHGVIQRVHGRGTFINRHALRVPANISQDKPFTEVLTEMGKDVATRSEVSVGAAPASMLQRFQWTQPREVCVVRRIFIASGVPAVFAIDCVPLELFPSREPPSKGSESVFDFLRYETHRQVRYSVAEIVPTLPSNEAARTLEVDRDRPTLLLENTHIDESDEPVAFTQAYINDRVLRFSVVRTYTDA